MERSHINNGRFFTDLSSWTASNAVYLSSDGDDHYGMASITAGGSISQPFTVPSPRLYSLHVALKPGAASGTIATAQITQNGDPVTTQNLIASSLGWTEQTLTLGLVPGAAYTLTINALADVKVDDIWLWFVPLSRAAIATRVEARLSSLASDAGLSTAATTGKTEGDYSYAIDAALRQIGAIDPETAQPDIRYLGTSDIDSVLQMAEREMLQQLHRYYVLQVDISVGQRRESLSQIAKSIEALLSSKASDSRQAKSTKASRNDTWPYDTYDSGQQRYDGIIRVRDDSGL